MKLLPRLRGAWHALSKPAQDKTRIPDFNPPGAPKAAFVRSLKRISWIAFAVLVYVVWLRGLDFSRDTSFALSISHIGFVVLDGPIQFWFPLSIVALGLAVVLGLNAKYALPILTALRGKGSAQLRTAQVGMWLITIATIVATLTASFPLVHDSMNGKYRETAVAVETVKNSQKGKQAEIAELRRQLNVLTEEGADRPSTEGKAAREGAAGWSEKVAIAKSQLDSGQLTDTGYARIERAQSMAKSADALRDKITAKIGEAAAGQTVASVGKVTVEQDYGAEFFAGFWSTWWPLIAFFSLEMTCLYLMLIAVVLETKRDEVIEAYHKAKQAEHEERQAREDEMRSTMRIEDQTSTPQAMPQEITYDDEGNEMIFVRTGFDENGNIKGHWRKKPKPKTDKPTEEKPADEPKTEPTTKANSQHWKPATTVEVPAEIENTYGDVDLFDTADPVRNDVGTDDGAASGPSEAEQEIEDLSESVKAAVNEHKSGTNLLSDGIASDGGYTIDESASAVSLDLPNDDGGDDRDLSLDEGGSQKEWLVNDSDPEETQTPVSDGNAITVWSEEPEAEHEQGEHEDQPTEQITDAEALGLEAEYQQRKYGTVE